MEFEYDPDKDAINLRKHQLPLIFGRMIFFDVDHIVLASIRPIDGEDRYKVVGLVEGRLHTAVFVLRGEQVRLISVRRSNAGEQRVYHSDPG